MSSFYLKDGLIFYVIVILALYSFSIMSFFALLSQKAEKKIDPKVLAPKDDIYDKTRKRKQGHEYKVRCKYLSFFVIFIY